MFHPDWLKTPDEPEAQQVTQQSKNFALGCRASTHFPLQELPREPPEKFLLKFFCSEFLEQVCNATDGLQNPFAAPLSSFWAFLQ